jgi:hypothetical protein
MVKRIMYEHNINATDSSGLTEDITNRVRLYTLDLTEQAEEGSTALSSFIVDDPDGDYDIVGWRRIWIYEDAAAGSNNLTGVWWIGDRTIERGPFETGAARQWTLTLVDYNTLLSTRILHNPDANRPAETDIARLDWLVNTLGTPGITTTEYVNPAGPKNMDEADYRGQSRLDVISDCAQQSGKNYFIYIRNNGDGTHDRGLWYDFASSTQYSSPIRLSNVLTDVDNNFTFAIADDTQLVRDPGRTYSGAYVRFDGGAAYEEDFTISNNFTRRDAVYDASNVKHLTTATNRALRYLTQSADEEDRIKTAFYVPEAKVNFVKPGMRLQFRASHLPGYESFSWLRVLKKQILEVSEAPESTYLMTLELASSGSSLPSTCSARGGQLVIHTTQEPTAPDARYSIYTGSVFTAMTLRVSDIAPGDYTYSVPAGQCSIWLVGNGAFGGVPFDGVTWTPAGGSSTYYPENGDGAGGHFFQYDNSIPNSFTADASLWSFPVYQYTGAGGVGGKTDYGIGLNNGIAFVLP